MTLAGSAPAGRYDGVALSFQEPMYGYFKPGTADPTKGAALGKEEGLRLGFDVQIRIGDLGRFFRDPKHAAELVGTVSSPLFGGARPIRDGKFELFSVDPASGMRRMLYSFHFEGPDRQTYFLRGHKEISDERGKLDLVEDMTRLFTRVHSGEDESAPVYGAGELYFHLTDGPSLMTSMKVENAPSWTVGLGARVAFASFAWGALREEYFKPVRLFYDSGYENLLGGNLASAASGVETPFFFISGAHDKGFPWGERIAPGAEMLRKPATAVFQRRIVEVEHPDPRSARHLQAQSAPEPAHEPRPYQDQLEVRPQGRPS